MDSRAKIAAINNNKIIIKTFYILSVHVEDVFVKMPLRHVTRHDKLIIMMTNIQ